MLRDQPINPSAASLPLHHDARVRPERGFEMLFLTVATGERGPSLCFLVIIADDLRRSVLSIALLSHSFSAFAPRSDSDIGANGLLIAKTERERERERGGRGKTGT